MKIIAISYMRIAIHKGKLKMAKSFSDSNGSAKKNNLDYMKFEEGMNTFRIVGDILPRYVYWKKLNTNNIPVECLSFDRDEERFMNAEKDWFKEMFPLGDDGKETRCVWSYVGRAIDRKDGKLKMLGFKKKAFEQIQELAAKKAYGDPTNIKTGWDIPLNKVKTGAHAFNVEYRLDALEVKVAALSDGDLALIKDMPDIDTLIPRPTPDQQKQFIDNAWFGAEEANADDGAAKAAAGDKFDEDIPF